MREVFFIQSRFPSSMMAFEDLLDRWETYACELEAIYGLGSIKVVSPFQKIENNDCYAHLSFLSKSKNALNNVISFIRLVNSTKQPVTLICGDNQFSLFVSVICRWIFPEKVKIQCQFHGDIYTSKNNPGLKGFLRVISSRFAFHQSDSIRIVSEFQESEIMKIAPKIKANFVVSPIPIDYFKIPKQRTAETIYDVVVVGRLHVERGIKNSTLIIKETIKSRSRTKIALVGEGKLMESISYELAEEIRSGSVVLLGALYGGQLRDLYASSKILLSAAPREGYGLALREACLSGMVVVAQNSEGAREAGRNFPGSFVFFESVQEATMQVLREIENFTDKTNRTELIQIQLERESLSLRKLLESWVRG